MELIDIIQGILERQLREDKKILVDILLNNGNIFLKLFHIQHYSETSQTITGLTLMEAYAHVREEREPVYSTFHISEIKSITEHNYESVLLPSIEL